MYQPQSDSEERKPCQRARNPRGAEASWPRGRARYQCAQSPRNGSESSPPIPAAAASGPAAAAAAARCAACAGGRGAGGAGAGDSAGGGGAAAGCGLAFGRKRRSTKMVYDLRGRGGAAAAAKAVAARWGVDAGYGAVAAVVPRPLLELLCHERFSLVQATQATVDKKDSFVFGRTSNPIRSRGTVATASTR